MEVPPGATLLDAARQAGLPLASSCGAVGLCARCGVRILEGEESVPPETPGEARAKQRNRVEAGLRLCCLLRPEADLVVTTPYW